MENRKLICVTSPNLNNWTLPFPTLPFTRTHTITRLSFVPTVPMEREGEDTHRRWTTCKHTLSIIILDVKHPLLCQSLSLSLNWFQCLGHSLSQSLSSVQTYWVSNTEINGMYDGAAETFNIYPVRPKWVIQDPTISLSFWRKGHTEHV